MAVTHCMDSVLALSVPLAEEVLSQSVSFGERVGVKRVADIHHLVDCKECLVASLFSLS